jgi:1,4-dihydroxy-2-naphthoate octaprenyltransferase
MAVVSNQAARRARDKVWQGFWRLADPKISITSLACMIVGGSAAAAQMHLDWPWLLVTGLALFCMEVAKNAWGDVFDYDSGADLAVAAADRTPFSGGKRVLVDGLLTRAQTWAMALGFGAAGCALGAAIVFWRAPAALWVGIAGLVLGWSYHGPPLRLAYRGLGELDVLVCYGPLVSLATYVIQTGTFSWDVVWLSLPLGVFTAAFLLANEFPDYLADQGAGKRNLVVRLGRRAASRLLPFVYAAGFGVTLMLPLLGQPTLVLLGMLPFPVAVWLCVAIWREPDSFYRHRPAQPAALLVFVLHALGVGIGKSLG